MGGLDGLLAGNAEALNTLPIEKRANIPNGLPEELSIKDIAILADPNEPLKQEATIVMLVGLCKAGLLKYYGDINGWEYREDMPNPFPKVRGDYGLLNFMEDKYWMRYAYSSDCLIHRDDFKFYLQSQGQWPVSGLLANWWSDEQPITESSNNAANISQAPNKKPLIKHERRLKILKEWYAKICTKHENNREIIIKEIDSLRTTEILDELSILTLKEDKHIWKGDAAEIWLGKHGKTVWEFERTQNGKPRKKV